MLLSRYKSLRNYCYLLEATQRSTNHAVSCFQSFNPLNPQYVMARQRLDPIPSVLKSASVKINNLADDIIMCAKLVYLNDRISVL